MKLRWRRPTVPSEPRPDHWEFYVGGPLDERILPIWGPPYQLAGYKRDPHRSTPRKIVLRYTGDYSDAA